MQNYVILFVICFLLLLGILFFLEYRYHKYVVRCIKRSERYKQIEEINRNYYFYTIEPHLIVIKQNYLEAHCLINLEKMIIQ